MAQDKMPPSDTIIIETVTVQPIEIQVEGAEESRKPETHSSDRPLHVDENSYDPLTIARMTDHNVTGHPDSTASQIEQDDRFRGLFKKGKKKDQ